MNDKLKIITEICAYVLAWLVVLYLFLKILNESKTFRLIVQIFALLVLIGSTIIYAQKYLGNS